MSALAQHPCGVSGVKSLGRMSRRGVPEVEVTVYHFPLDGNPADMDAGTKIFQGQTSDDGKVTCRVSPGCYVIVVSVPHSRRLGGSSRGRGGGSISLANGEEKGSPPSPPKECRRLMLVDPARGHLEKRSVVVPIEV